MKTITNGHGLAVEKAGKARKMVPPQASPHSMTTTVAYFATFPSSLHAEQKHARVPCLPALRQTQQRAQKSPVKRSAPSLTPATPSPLRGVAVTCLWLILPETAACSERAPPPPLPTQVVSYCARGCSQRLRRNRTHRPRSACAHSPGPTRSTRKLSRRTRSAAPHTL